MKTEEIKSHCSGPARGDHSSREAGAAGLGAGASNPLPDGAGQCRVRSTNGTDGIALTGHSGERIQLCVLHTNLCNLMELSELLSK